MAVHILNGLTKEKIKIACVTGRCRKREERIDGELVAFPNMDPLNEMEESSSALRKRLLEP